VCANETPRQQSDPARPGSSPVGSGDCALSRDNASLWLEKAYEQRSTELIFFKVDPEWDTLRSDPRYADLLRHIGFPQ
jgi:hypothetical protein